MKKRKSYLTLLLLLLTAAVFGAAVSEGAVLVQCPCPPDTSVSTQTGNIECTIGTQEVACKHLAAGDGFANMADGSTIYTFGYTDVTGVAPTEIMSRAILKSDFPAPTISLKQGQEFYLTLTNVGFMMRPDLFDAHTVHFHGFPNASSFFDGEPMASFGANMGASFTYYYKILEPGTFMYHCHVEATEHMQMGMLGNWFVRPAQDDSASLKNLGSPPYTGFAYNDGDGSTGYHVAYPIQIHAVDPAFHEADLMIQPLNFAFLEDKYSMLNGRGYPDTINTVLMGASPDNMDYPSQKVNSLITATAGQKVLLRISNLSFDFYTLTTLGIPMMVVGRDAKLLRGPGPSNRNLYYTTNSVTLGGGQSADVILNTTGLAAGRYFLYTTNLNHLTNNGMERGGMMTEIVIN